MRVHNVYVSNYYICNEIYQKGLPFICTISGHNFLIPLDVRLNKHIYYTVYWCLCCNNLLDVCFLQRVCDNSQGVINFCLFCLFTKEVRSAAIIAIRKLCHCQSGNIIALMPDVSWFTPSINDTRSTLTADYNTLSSQENENPLDPSVIY